MGGPEAAPTLSKVVVLCVYDRPQKADLTRTRIALRPIMLNEQQSAKLIHSEHPVFIGQGCAHGAWAVSVSYCSQSSADRTPRRGTNKKTIQGPLSEPPPCPPCPTSTLTAPTLIRTPLLQGLQYVLQSGQIVPLLPTDAAASAPAVPKCSDILCIYGYRMKKNGITKTKPL